MRHFHSLLPVCSTAILLMFIPAYPRASSTSLLSLSNKLLSPQLQVEFLASCQLLIDAVEVLRDLVELLPELTALLRTVAPALHHLLLSLPLQLVILL